MSREGRRRWGVLQSFLIGQPGNPMMKRLRLLQTPWFGLYLHFIYREDLDPIPHDHPWVFWRLILWGGYEERYWTLPTTIHPARHVWRRRGSVSRFPTEHAHYIRRVLPGTTSLVLVGPKVRVWGFWKPLNVGIGSDPTQPTYGRLVALGREWVDYRDALALRPTEGSRSQHDGGYPGRRP